MDIVLTGAFVIAATAFLREQLGLRGYVLMASAFGVTLLASFYPLILESLPVLAPWLERFVNAVVVFVGSAGTVDFANYAIKRNAQAAQVVQEEADADF